MFGILKRGFVLGLSVLVLTVFSNAYHANAHDECCSTEAECCAETKCPVEGTCEKLPETKEELLKIKEGLKQHLSDPKVIEKGDEAIGKIKDCLSKVDEKLASITEEETNQTR